LGGFSRAPLARQARGAKYGVNVRTSFIPSTDAGLLAWSLNFASFINASPSAYGLSTVQATAYQALHSAYATALAACDPTVRSKSTVAVKNAARTDLKKGLKLLVSVINGQTTVTDGQKIELGLNVRAMPSSIPAPALPPGLSVVSVVAWTVRIKLYDKNSSGKRGKPAGVNGASVFSFVGAEPPSDISAWKFEQNTGHTTMDLVFQSTIAPGTKVWLTGFWFNGRKQNGPACAPVSTNLQGGSVSMAA
jgi:hypothetical protein